MKSFNFILTSSSLLKKIIPIFFLSILLQGTEGGCSGSISSAKPEEAIRDKNDMPQLEAIIFGYNGEKLREYLASRQCGADFLKLHLKYILHEFVNRRKHTRLKMVLESCHTKGINKELQTALNTHYGGARKRTLLGIAIEKSDLKMFNLLIEQEVDFNRKHEKSTPLLLAMRNKNKQITSTLLNKQGIDITSQSPTSENTTLHKAIKNNWVAIANDLIERLKQTEKGSKLLHAQNKEGDTPLHFAVKYGVKQIQPKLIENLSVEQIYETNNKGEDAVFIGSKNNQPYLVEQIMKAPLEKLTKRNKEGETWLHIFAHLKLSDAFNKVLKRLGELNKDEAVKQLFEKNRKGKSVWVSLILSKINRNPIISHKTNVTMFKDAIFAAKGKLTKTHWDTIKNDIARLETKHCLVGGITKNYTDELRKIVENNMQYQNIPPPL